ncbi:MAG: transposase [Proteobacteria bacterium]|uniref:Transposase n=1 Tax=Candidatus Avisuccinivibrio stercorigallinarum TaxID=2840704 RepID=A0A9D9DCS2_9GAMM|nr:transposase [Candidatus Avisuccinivibrio stercorigallinarum]
MTTLLLRPAENASLDKLPTNIIDILGSILETLARNSGLIQRKRKVTIDEVVRAWVDYLCIPHDKCKYTLAALREHTCNKLGIHTESTPYHNCVSREGVQEYVTELLSILFGVIAQSFDRGGASDRIVRRLAKKLHVNDIVAIDGMELRLYPRCIANLGDKCKSKTDTTAAFKLHIAYSILNKKIVYINLSEGTGDERENVEAELLKGSLVLMDRGYESAELFDKLDANNVKFVVRGKKSRNGRVISSYNMSSGRALKAQALVGKDLKDLCKIASKKSKDVDLYCDTDGSVRRVVAMKKPECSRSKTPYGLYYTNLTRDVMNGEGIYLLYRIRWQVELFIKGLRSGSSLRQSINSANETINILYIGCCLIAAGLKLHFGAKVAQYRLEMLSLLKVMREPLTGLYDWMQARVDNMCRVTIYTREQAILSQMKKFCERKKASSRDQKLNKDLPTLINSILQEIGKLLVNREGALLGNSPKTA